MIPNSEFFAPLENTKPFLKIAFEGFAGSGKTFTMAQTAAGLHARIGSTKPIVIFDTEEAAKFLKRFFAERKIPMLHKPSRSLADLHETMNRCADGAADIVMVDSITHVWEDFLRAYLAKKKRARLYIDDWTTIKPLWKSTFSEPFVRLPVHALMTGRAAHEYTESVSDEGKREIVKTGIKMRAEGETAYEPDLLVLMERKEDVLGDTKRVWREATVLKDRSSLIDGKTFRNPNFESFSPTVEYVLEEPVARAVAPEVDASGLVEGDSDRRDFARRREIAIEKIEAFIVEALPGQTAETKRRKVALYRDCFGTTSWTEVKDMHPDKLEAALEAMQRWMIAATERESGPRAVGAAE